MHQVHYVGNCIVVLRLITLQPFLVGHYEFSQIEAYRWCLLERQLIAAEQISLPLSGQAPLRHGFLVSKATLYLLHPPSESSQDCSRYPYMKIVPEIFVILSIQESFQWKS